KIREEERRDPSVVSPTASANGSVADLEETDLPTHAEVKSVNWEIAKRFYKIPGAWSERQIYDDWLNEAVGKVTRHQLQCLADLYSRPESDPLFHGDFARYAQRKGNFAALLSSLPSAAQQAEQ